MSSVQVQWTYTDEAPMLATYSLFPIAKSFSKAAGVDLVMKDISVAGRVLAHFPECLTSEQRVEDELANLGNLAKTPVANIVKLPNISASVPQLVECISELQSKGYAVPNFPENPSTPEEKEILQKYSKVLGSAVNPVLREGNSDRRAATAVKKYAMRFPHKMGPWSSTSKTHVSHMSHGDFFGSEKSVVIDKQDTLRIEHVATDGKVSVLKDGLKVIPGEVVDGSCMSVKELCKFFDEQIKEAKEQDVLLSLHLKATMMKVSDPIMFGYCVKSFFKDLFAKHAQTFKEIGVNANLGFGDVLKKIEKLPEEKRKEIQADIEDCYAKQPKLAMVDSNRGITNLHVPSDVIIDASMPAMIRGMDGLGGGMWCPDSKPGAKDSHLCDTKALIPDRCYAGVFKEAVDFCKKNGAFDVTKMGSVPNVGLMAQKAEEYGSHDKTFEAPSDGRIRVVSASTGDVIFEHMVGTGDIWRACQTKDIAIKDWVKLAVTRARATGWPAIFWLDINRAHDRNIIGKVSKYLAEHDVAGFDFQILPPTLACRASLQRAHEGLNTISVTGNVLRDYNTDLFPILELGTSAKMLSIVPLLAGGGMYETGAGGSAPKHVQQFQEEGHLRWDSLGEFLAYASCLEDNAAKLGDAALAALAEGLNKANDRFLDANKNPSRKVKEIDNRGSHFFLALYWAEAMTESSHPELRTKFAKIAQELRANEGTITDDLIQCQGKPVDLGGYYKVDDAKAERAMRPSEKLNEILSDFERSAAPGVEIQWTYTDEAPMLATYSLYPIVKSFSKAAGVSVAMKDISVAGRVLAHFPECLAENQRIDDELSNLGKLAKTPAANIVKLPNISASVPQLVECIAELQGKGYKIPNYPENPKTSEEKEIMKKYAQVLGSAVNPVLREGNSDRRAATAVKKYAMRFPHKMGPWSSTSKTHVSHMSHGDFFGSEKSVVMETEETLRIEHVASDGKVSVLKDGLKVIPGEVVDGSCMSVKELCKFFDEQIKEAKEQDVLLSLHLKATMMKVSDPIMFGYCVKSYFKDLFAKHAQTFKEIGVNANLGFGDVLKKIEKLPEEKRKEIQADIEDCYAKQPKLAMVDSNRGVTNLHVPSDVIIDASMPAMIRGMDGLGGGMWCPDSKPGAKDSHLCDTKALIPDRCYAGVFKEAVDFCKKNGAFDVTTMGSVPNVGLMAQKAEEYGSHDKTFEAPSDGRIRVVNATTGDAIFEHSVETGDIWRACQTKDIAIKDWVKLAVTRARATGWPAIFWLDINRAHDRNIIGKVSKYLAEHDVSGFDFQILPPTLACRESLARAKEGKSTISVTGNVLRDYNTDLFPILELGTSAKMLSIVPLLAGGGMYETGAGGSAPKHVQQFQEEGHLRWDSLGEFLAYASCLEDNAAKLGDARLAALAEGMNKANDRFLDANRNPSRKVKEIDNRGSHFYLALYWAEAMAESSHPELKTKFQKVAADLKGSESEINNDLIQCQGAPVDLGGYYKVDETKADKAMRPSAKFNGILADFEKL